MVPKPSTLKHCLCHCLCPAGTSSCSTPSSLSSAAGRSPSCTGTTTSRCCSSPGRWSSRSSRRPGRSLSCAAPPPRPGPALTLHWPRAAILIPVPSTARSIHATYATASYATYVSYAAAPDLIYVPRFAAPPSQVNAAVHCLMYNYYSRRAAGAHQPPAESSASLMPTPPSPSALFISDRSLLSRSSLLVSPLPPLSSVALPIRRYLLSSPVETPTLTSPPPNRPGVTLTYDKLITTIQTVRQRPPPSVSAVLPACAFPVGAALHCANRVSAGPDAHRHRSRLGLGRAARAPANLLAPSPLPG